MSAPLKLSRLFRKTVSTTFLRTKTSAAQAQSQAESTKPWKLHGAVCVMRPPIISKDPSPIEQKYQDYLREMETNRSHLSDFEVDVVDFERKQELRKKGLDKSTESETELFKVVDLQVKWETENKEFTPATRDNDPEVDADFTSLKRKMDRHLVLIVKQVWSERETVWAFPQYGHEEGNSMRQAAEQALETCSGGGINATFLGNAPCGYLHYTLPKEPEVAGVKVFFFKAMHAQGNVLASEDIEDYKWVTLDELGQFIRPNWMKKYKKFLVEY